MPDIIQADPFIKQAIVAQTTALISIANWMTKQPTADHNVLEGISASLAGLPIILKHMGQEELGELLARTLSEAMERARSLR